MCWWRPRFAGGDLDLRAENLDLWVTHNYICYNNYRIMLEILFGTSNPDCMYRHSDTNPQGGSAVGQSHAAIQASRARQHTHRELVGDYWDFAVQISSSRNLTLIPRRGTQVVVLGPINSAILSATIHRLQY